MHATTVLWPFRLKKPALHEHAAEPAGAELPARHAEHVVAPLALYVLAGHDGQDDWPAVPCAEPAAHGVHVDATGAPIALLKEPAAQLVQPVAPVCVWYVPAPQ